jgi:hypothetical protein
MRLYRSKTVLLLVILSLSYPVVLQAAPPKVIETTPRDGDLNVDPTLREMRFVFDQAMRRGGFSICGGGATFPKIIGRARWADSRTLVARVQLVPDHEYRLSINCPAAQNCRSARGEPAVPCPMMFRTAAADGATRAVEASPQTNAQAVATLREAIDAQYSYRDLHGLDWAALFAEYTPALEHAKTATAFAEAASKLLAHARDMHIWLTVNGTTVHPFRREIERNYNLDTLAKVVPGFRKRSAAVYTGQFANGVGYILIDSWGQERADALEQTYVAIWEFSEAPGLIVDVRPNGGGAESLAQGFAGCFVDKPVVYAGHVNRSPDAASGFGRPRRRVLEPNKRRPKYRGRVAVLTGPANMSSCEAFLLMMKQVPNCKLVGATSYGSSGNPKPVDLGNGVTVFLPSWKALRPDGICFEGQGIAPDVPINVTATELETADPVLQAALALLASP